MKIIETALNGIILFENDVFSDERGFFFESYNEARLKDFGIIDKFVQDNVSVSSKNVLRGLHAQRPPFTQGKFCQVLSGSVIDFAVDIRADSETFGKSYQVELSSENRLSIWIPPGFVHGFLSKEDGTMFHYKCSNYYSKKHEVILSFNEFYKQLGLDPAGKCISQKDLLGLQLATIEKVFSHRLDSDASVI